MIAARMEKPGLSDKAEAFLGEDRLSGEHLQGIQVLVAGGWWLVAGGWWLVAGGWWLVAGGWWVEKFKINSVFDNTKVNKTKEVFYGFHKL